MVAAGAMVSCEREAPSGGPIKVSAEIGGVGRAPGQFSYPRGMDVYWAGGQARLVIVDKTARVQVLDAATGKVVASFRTPERELGKPTGLTVGPHPFEPGRTVVYVADTHYYRVLVYDLDGGDGPVLEFGEYGRGPGQFVYPTDIAVLTDDAGAVERVYVSEYGGNDRISIFEPGDSGELEWIASFGSFGVPGEGDGVGIVFNRPQALVIDRAARELIVADACNHRIGRFTLDGELIAWIGGPASAGPGVGELSYPYGLALLDDRTVLVAEFGNSRVQHFDLESGRSLGIFGEPGRGDGQLATPWAVGVLGTRAWVLDSGNNRAVSFASPGRAATGSGL